MVKGVFFSILLVCSQWVSVNGKNHDTYLFNFAINGGEGDVVFLDNARVKRVEVHNKDELIPKTRFSAQTPNHPCTCPSRLSKYSSMHVAILSIKYDSGSCLFADILYLRQWNLWSRIHSFYSAQPPLRFCSWTQKCQWNRPWHQFSSYQELPARFVSCLVRGKITPRWLGHCRWCHFKQNCLVGQNLHRYCGWYHYWSRGL